MGPAVRGSVGVLAAAALALLWTTPASATPLQLELLQFPDVVSGFLDVTYSSGSDTLSISGFALELDDDGVGEALTIQGGLFDLTASIDAAGALSAGTLTISGAVPSLGFDSGTLLTGVLTAFGFPDSGGDPLEFVFAVTGGDLAGLYGTGPAGLIVGQSGFGASFASDFDNLLGGPGTGAGVSNAAPVPEAGTALLLGVALGGLGWSGRRRSRSP